MLFALMRLFAGISLDDAVTHNLVQMLAPLRAVANLRWTAAENLHITSKFIGAWPEDRLAELRSSLAAIDPPGNLEIAISHPDFFPDAHRPRVLLAGVNSGPGLAELARKINDALEPLGSPREDRPYSPHVTLVRIGKDQSRESVRKLGEHVASMTNLNFGSFVAESFALFLSQPYSGGSVYTKLASWPLGRST
jgi:RNA 2',3'-cyclic 3'-phosphodiesterase